MNRLLFPFPAALLLFLAPLAVSADEPKGDLLKLQGTWTAKVGPEKNVPIAITIKGNAVALKITTPEGVDYSTDGEIKIDDTAKPFKTIDWRKFTNPKGEDIADNLGIYEFTDADTLRVCSGGPGNDRPTEFQAGDLGKPSLIVLNRQADKK